MENTINFGGISAQPGEKAQGFFTIAGSKYRLPVAVINGKANGKIILLTASIHGFEYPGIQCSIELIKELQPEEISGAVVILPVVNASGFFGRHPYICPEDEGNNNLNRVGPGRPDGTFAERLIYQLEEEFVKKCDFHLDLHSGEATEALLRFCAIGNHPDAKVRDMIHNIIHHLDFEYHTQSSGSTEFYNSSAKYANVPSMMFECGGEGTWSREEVDFEKCSIRKIMQMLDILPGKPAFNPYVKCIVKQSWIACKATGFFYDFCKVGDTIKQGQKLFEIRDVWGNLLQEYYAEHDGKVFILNHTLGVSEGDDAIFYGCDVGHNHNHHHEHQA